MRVYNRNLQLLRGENPFLALQLLVAEISGKPCKVVGSFPESHAQVLYLSGLGDDRWLKQGLDWVESDEKRNLVFLEEDLGVIHRFLSLDLAGRVVTHPRITLVSPPFKEALRPVVLSHLYQTWDYAGEAPVREVVTQLNLWAESMVALYRDFGISQLMNVFSNLLTSYGVRSGEALFGKFAQIPAIICGAGPSLERHFAELRGLEDRALIFGGGSALVPLSEGGISCHFATALDPASPKERFARQSYHEVPLFYQNQLSHSVFLLAQGEKLCLGENGSFPLEEWLDLPLSPCDVGWSATTFATQIAYQLGCDPIIFVGLDLCISGEKAYAGGMDELRANPITCTDRYGNRVETRADFLLAKRWLESFARGHPERSFLNATGEGLLLEGVADVPLVLERASYDLKAKAHQFVVAAPPLDLSHVQSKLGELHESLNRCMELLKDDWDGVGLEGEPFYEAHLMPLWGVWRHLLQTKEICASMRDPAIEKQLQQTLLFKQVTQSFKELYERKISI